MAEEYMSVIEDIYNCIETGKIEEADKKFAELHRGYETMVATDMEENKYERDHPEPDYLKSVGLQLGKTDLAIRYVKEGKIKPDEVKGFATADKTFINNFKEQIYNSIKTGEYKNIESSLEVLKSIGEINNEEDKVIKELIRDAKGGKSLPEDIGGYVRGTVKEELTYKNVGSQISTDATEDFKTADHGNIAQVIKTADKYDSSLGDKFRELQAELESTITNTKDEKLSKIKKDLEETQ